MFYTLINLKKQDVIKNRLFNRYDYHQYVWSFFKKEVQRNFLFDVEDNGDEIIFRILSEKAPEKCDCVEIDKNFFNYNTYYVDIRFCPVKKDVKTKKRFAITNKEQILSWLKRNVEKFGIKVIELELTSRPDTEIYFKDKNKIFRTSVSAKMIISGNEVSIENFMTKGIGVGKSDGFGMPKLYWSKMA